MEYNDISTRIIEFLGTFAFAISGIRHAAAKHFDWFGGYVCGIAVAIGGGTIRDVMLGTTPFWMTSPIYMICTALALLFVIVFAKHMEGLRNTWFVFDTLGLPASRNRWHSDNLTGWPSLWVVSRDQRVVLFAMYCSTTNQLFSIAKYMQWQPLQEV